MGLDTSAWVEVERVFLEDAADRIELLATALERFAAGDLAQRQVGLVEAHSLRGAAAIVGRDELAELCRSIEDLLGDDRRTDAAELLAAARLLRRERRALTAPRTVGARWWHRLVPRSFMRQLALILLLAVVPAVAFAVYDTLHDRGHAVALVGRNAAADAALTAEAERQLVLGGRRLLTALAEIPEVRSGGRASCSHVLARYAARFEPYFSFAAFGRDGRVVCASVPLPASYAVVRDPGFAAALASGRFAVGPLERDPVRGRRFVGIAQPLPGGGSARAEIGAALALTGIQAVLRSVDLPPGGAIVTLDRDGAVLARRPDPARYVGRNVELQPIRELAAGGGTAESRGVDGTRRLYAYRTAGPWYVGVGLPTAREDAKLMHQLVLELALLGGCGLLGLGLGLGSAQRALGRPLRTLVATTRRLGAGDLDARTGLDPNRGELGELAAALDAMADGLARRTAEREQALADLSGLARDLERRVADRTEALDESRLAAERLSEAKTGFLARLSHELRTPLNAVRGFAQLLVSEPLAPVQADAAAHLVSAAEHMTRLVDELLDMARIEAGEFRVDLEAARLAPVLEEAVELARPSAADHGVTLVAADVDPELTVLADRIRLRQVLLNLIANGIAYNRRGGTVTMRGRRDEPGRVEIDVVDTGAGIPPEDLNRLFVPYDRLGRGAESGGLGLGLALSRRLVEAMAGTIAVESEPGVGSRFTVSLVEGDAARAPARPPAPRSGRRRVLHIEDNAASRRLIELLVRGREIEFVGAASAAEGLVAARTSSPDLILLDLGLPDRDGEEVVRELREEESLRAVPIVVLSGEASRESVRRLLEAGADDYLVKPVEVDRAAELIERLLRRAG